MASSKSSAKTESDDTTTPLAAPAAPEGRTLTQTTIRNAALLLVQKGSQFITAALFATIVPRLMGPDIFGRYALITSVLIWFGLLGGVSLVQTMSRFTPEFIVRGDTEGLKKLFGSLLVMRFFNASGAALLYFAFTSYWFPELDRVTLMIVASTIVIRSAEKLFFALFLGLNQANRWGMGDTINRWLSLFFVIGGFYGGGLRGACLGIGFGELVLLLIAISFARPYLTLSAFRLDRKYLMPYLRFGLSFFGSSLLFSLFQQSGETLMRIVSSDYAQVGHYGLAFRIYFTVTITMWQFGMAFSPLINTWKTQGNDREIARCTESLLKWMATGGVVIIMATALMGADIAPFAFGSEYHPVARNLIPLTLALLPFALIIIGRMLAFTYNRPGIAFQVAMLQFLCYLGLGIPLIQEQGSFGGSLAVLIAISVSGLYFAVRIRQALPFSLWQWGQPILLGSFFAPLAWLRSSVWVNIACLIFFLLAYGSLLARFRVVTRGEVMRISKAFRRVRVAT